MKSILFLFALTTLLACDLTGNKRPSKLIREFSPSEQAAMDSARIDYGVSIQLRTHVPETFYLHKPEADLINARSGFPPKQHMFKGVAFKVAPDSVSSRIAALSKRIFPEGYMMYRSRRSFAEADEVCVLMTQQDPTAILRYEQTDGMNYGITTDSLISVLDSWWQELDLNLTGASHDWVEASIGKPPADWNELAKRVYAVCPDVVDQGTGSVDALAEEMERTRTLYLWWD